MFQFTPQLRIWIDVRKICVALYGASVYEYLPPDNTNYPFVHLKSQFKQDLDVHKDFLNGRTQVIVDVWHNDTDFRGTVATMMGNIETSVRVKYKRNLLEANTQIITDNSTGKELLHGIIEFNIKY